VRSALCADATDLERRSCRSQSPKKLFAQTTSPPGPPADHGAISVDRAPRLPAPHAKAGREQLAKFPWKRGLAPAIICRCQEKKRVFGYLGGGVCLDTLPSISFGDKALRKIGAPTSGQTLRGQEAV